MKKNRRSHQIYRILLNLHIFLWIAVIMLFTSSLCPIVSAEEHHQVPKTLPSFTIQSVSGEIYTKENLTGKVIVLHWVNSGCPFTLKHFRSGFIRHLLDTYSKENVAWLFINSTNPDYTSYKNEEEAKQFFSQYNVPHRSLIIDGEGIFARLLGATTTPEIFVYDTKGLLAYHGALESSGDPFDDPLKSTNFVGDALNQVLKGLPAVVPETRPLGCHIKFRSRG